VSLISDIILTANREDKNILIFGSPRSGTHALGLLFFKEDTDLHLLGEICKDNPREEIRAFCTENSRKIGQIVQMSAKLRISWDIASIRDSSIVVRLRRRNKVSQFSSWMYSSKVSDNNQWHNYRIQDFVGSRGCIEATQSDIDQFIIEQMVDSFFVADYELYYEDIDFSGVKIKRNEYPFDLVEIFSNKDFVIESMSRWGY
jgi:hypothetical protein